MHSPQHCPANCQEDACTEVRLSGIKRLTVFVGIIPVALAVVIRPLQRSLLKIRGRSENEKKAPVLFCLKSSFSESTQCSVSPLFPPHPTPTLSKQPQQQQQSKPVIACGRRSTDWNQRTVVTTGAARLGSRTINNVCWPCLFRQVC